MAINLTKSNLIVLIKVLYLQNTFKPITMNVLKRTAISLPACLVICFLLSGCQLFTGAEKRLNEYCPGLKIDINGVNWQGLSPNDVIIVEYNRSFDKKVTTYFGDKNNGFMPDKGRSYSDIKTDDKPEIDDDDSIVSKTINKGKKTATVVFDESTRKIIIIETAEK
jgi:hypothetical protein